MKEQCKKCIYYIEGGNLLKGFCRNTKYYEHQNDEDCPGFTVIDEEWKNKIKTFLKQNEIKDNMKVENKQSNIEYASEYSHKVWEKLMEQFNNNENFYIGCNDVSDIVLNAILDALDDMSFKNLDKLYSYDYEYENFDNAY